ncbi:lipid IV(A) 3-deoxy-D-manno-octulosonic acid transferase [Sodalis sp. CWE]|uniref:lipid IV(A) 3-deoxy-D-manno-octulosonic acid transferase n=1 Tax=Sodalis sp. CWE TaxID=2803816 RepID=UPI001C7D01ED|nr:lipid IV(A) 3-deoxy-D-manno-octulosonic acid transferase [Sodalis sp. CWE]MBX4180959.1 lipid IV(A) 3-deoxy-D-manno-octulosonic acid transferase [Sodalis sp. CWE]
MIYSVIVYLIQPLIWVRLLWKSRKAPIYRQRWNERYGFCYGKVGRGGIVLHSVSVGETMAAVPLIFMLRRYYPFLSITVTTMTPSGSERVQKIFGKDIYHVYLPYDLPGSMKRFLDQTNPKLVIIMETELWPNLIKILHSRKVPLIIANARLSIRSFNRYKKFRNFISDIMRCITFVAAQSKEDGLRFLQLGLQKNQLVISGNLKFDISVNSSLMIKSLILRKKWASHRLVWIATNTHDGEEIILLQAYRKLLTKFPNLLLILAPRHPERFSKVLKIIIKAKFNYILRSSGKTPSSTTQVVMVDTMGELILLYGTADLAFIGGTLVKHGGHNPLEAALHAIPILMGPHTLNFHDICRKLNKSGGLITITNVISLISSVSALLTDKNYRLHRGYHAAKVLHQNKGASNHLLNLLKPHLL